MLLKICKYESTEDVISTLPVGNHIIGRGDNILQCNDKRVSRKHALIEITEDTAKITSKHINPCFFMAANSKTITILSKDSSQTLNNDDKFALLPDAFWFKIKVVDDDNKELTQTTNGEEEPINTLCKPSTSTENSNGNVQLSPSVKRPLDEFLDLEEANKRFKLVNDVENTKDVAEETGISNVSMETDDNKDLLRDIQSTQQIEMDATDTSIKLEDNKGDTEVKSNDNDSSEANLNISTTKEETATENNSNDEQVKFETNQSVEAKPEGVDETTSEEVTSSQPTTSTDNTSNKQKREKCWYGITCYRKNSVHWKEFIHPGDEDYDPNENRPICSFGASCYRKNQDHRREYYHPPSQAQPPTNNDQKKNRKKKTTKKREVSETPEDDYDYNDPFIDDSSDEYVEESADSDTDWNDSQEVQEDSQDTKQLLKEAKRFAK